MSNTEVTAVSILQFKNISKDLVATVYVLTSVFIIVVPLWIKRNSNVALFDSSRLE